MKTLTRVVGLSAALALGNQAFAQQAAPAPDDTVIRSLAERPVGIVHGDTCFIRGAVWAGKPRAGVDIILIDVVSAQGYTATTGANGAYALEIPYSHPVVYQERLLDEVRAPAEVMAALTVREGGVVCDDRLSLFLTKEAN